VQNPNEARNKLIKATALCFCFMIAELVGGYLAHSLAIMTDAAHLMSDMAGFAISIVAISLAQKEANMQYSFGYHRAEILGALASVMLIWALTGVLVYEAIIRLTEPKDQQVEGFLMFIISTLGILVNGAMMLVLGGHGHSHAGGGGHGGGEGHVDGDEPQEATENINVEAAWVHVIGDLIQGVGVMIAAILIWWAPHMQKCGKYDPDCGDWTVVLEYNTSHPTAASHIISNITKWDGQDEHTYKSGINWYLADPACTLLFSILVMYTTVGIVKSSIGVLMARAPPEINMKSLNDKLSQIVGAVGVHDLHCWQVSQGKNAMSVHIQIESTEQWESVMGQAQDVVAKYASLHACIQLDVGDCVAHGHWQEGKANDTSEDHGHSHAGGAH
jgi:zinc transporter 2